MITSKIILTNERKNCQFDEKAIAGMSQSPKFWDIHQAAKLVFGYTGAKYTHFARKPTI
ncbi:hypothetical protein [Nostoc sp. FACHB-280]|uniref:hypothetical protein n=1 Tax=Nostoc sp. FACHB-280 TaxID=2692839 RepID=UPI00168A6393|nr:hypothetical protein [Nostoc sp. FACHB-280]MBD2496951.1 hypothetical protein [Nostoc sp. FACHB-280]